jgi:hypothetical protein
MYIRKINLLTSFGFEARQHHTPVNPVYSFSIFFLNILIG